MIIHWPERRDNETSKMISVWKNIVFIVFMANTFTNSFSVEASVLSSLRSEREPDIKIDTFTRSGQVVGLPIIRHQ